MRCGAPVTVDVAVPCAAWRKALPDVRARAAAAALAALADQTLPPAAELSIVLADDGLLRRLNRRWRGRDAPTNVLSFANGAPLLGDVVLAFETVSREAAEQAKPLADHLAHLVTHGVLHLRGYDHETAGEARRMEALERRVLAHIGVADPYRRRESARG